MKGRGPTKSPAFQFYVRDWLTDEHLVCVSASTRGIWIDILCHAWLADQRGIVFGTRAELCRKLNCNQREWNRFVKDAEMHPFCDISEQNSVFIIKNRRMLRDELIRVATRERVKRHRKREGNTNVTPPSASATAAASACNGEREVQGIPGDADKSDTKRPSLSQEGDVSQHSEKARLIAYTVFFVYRGYAPPAGPVLEGLLHWATLVEPKVPDDEQRIHDLFTAYRRAWPTIKNPQSVLGMLNDGRLPPDWEAEDEDLDAATRRVMGEEGGQ